MEKEHKTKKGTKTLKVDYYLWKWLSKQKIDRDKENISDLIEELINEAGYDVDNK